MVHSQFVLKQEMSSHPKWKSCGIDGREQGATRGRGLWIGRRVRGVIEVTKIFTETVTDFCLE